MSHASNFIHTVRLVIHTMALFFCFSTGAFAQEIPNMEVLKAAKEITSVEAEKAEWALIQRQSTVFEKRNWYVYNAGFVMFLFGAFCALWAQNTRRSVGLWFLLGFVFTIFAILAILRINRKIKGRRKRRYRRSLDYWSFAHF